MERKYLRHSIVMVLLFLVGGFSLFLFIFQIYSAFWRSESISTFMEGNGNYTFVPRDYEVRGNLPPMGSGMNIIANNTRIRPPMDILSSPFSFMLLIVSILSILGAISIWQLVREKELKSVKEDITSLLMSPEEKAIVEELKKANGKMNQNQLVMKTGFTKVKVHRALARLETRKIIKKYPYGVTNKIVLEKTAI
jgi:uncharacterized membrane protein